MFFKKGYMPYVLALLVVLSSCSSFKKNPEMSETAKDLPEWVYSPQSGCQEGQELCASGEGRSLSEAEMRALQSLASIFEVKIESELSSTQTASSEGSVWREAREQASISVKESVSQILEAVQVTKRSRKDSFSYALAVLDVPKASGNLRRLIDQNDAELKVLWEKKSRTSLKKILRLYYEREAFSDRYAIMTGGRIPSPVKLQAILSWSKLDKTFSPVTLESGSTPVWLTDYLKQLLTEAGYKVVSGAAHEVKLKWDEKQEFMKVEGFQKWSFTFTAEHTNKNEKMGVLTKSYTATGRSKEDCQPKLQSQMKEDIAQDLDALEMDTKE